MNIQAMMKQAQQLQKEMMNAKNEIDSKTYVGKSSFVTIEMSGDKKITKVKLDVDKLEMDEIEILEDLIQVATNDAMDQIDKETEQKMGKYTKGMPGLF